MQIFRTSSSPMCQPPISMLYSTTTLHLSSFRITHFLLKQFPVFIHIHIHLPSKLFIYFLFTLIYTPFNLSLLLSVRFHTSFLCFFIASCQHLLPIILHSSNCSFISSFYHTLFGFFPPTLTEPHTSLALSAITRFTCSHI